MIIGLLKDDQPESRVAFLPDMCGAILQMCKGVCVETGAGDSSLVTDDMYRSAGAEVMSRSAVIDKSDILVSVNGFATADIVQLPADKVLIGAMNPLSNKDLVHALKKHGQTAFSLDLLPRTTRAQAMDILSSMATVAGYKAVLMAANHLPVFFPMFMTAAGTIPPGKVLILGAGVAGLQAIATARRLGAVVHVFDVRSAVREEVKSLGGKFVEIEGAKDDSSAGGYAVEQQEDFLKRQRQAIHDHATKADAIICTAQIPGRKAPELIFEDTVKEMKPGAVIVDLAASSGGNCVLTENNKTIQKHNVTIIGNSNLPALMPYDASRMFGKNLHQFLKLLLSEDGLNLDWEDDIIASTCITYNGDVKSERIHQFLD